jgi:hypothetical protein
MNRLKLSILLLLFLLPSICWAKDYTPSASCVDQGSTASGCTKALLNAIGATRDATLVYKHSSNSDTTTYTFTTPTTIPPTVAVKIEYGVVFAGTVSGGPTGLVWPTSLYLASDVEAIAGTSDSKLITPSSLAATLSATVPAIASEAEVALSQNTSKIVTPAGLTVYTTALGEIDALAKYGSGTSYTSATINAALVAAPAGSEILLRPGEWVITAAVDFTGYVLHMAPGAYFTISGAGSITGIGTISPEAFGFSSTATGAVNSAALYKAIRAAKKVVMPAGTFSMDTDIIEWPDFALPGVSAGADSLVGAGLNSTILDFSGSSTGTCITVGPIATGDVAWWAQTHGYAYLADFQIKGGASDYTSDQIGIAYNGTAYTELKRVRIYNVGYGIKTRGQIGYFNNVYIYPYRIGIWLNGYCFDNLFEKVTVGHGMYGVFSGAVITSPFFSADMTTEGTYSARNTFHQVTMGGIKAVDTGGGSLLGGIAFLFSNGTSQPTVSRCWVEEVWGPGAGYTSGIGVQLGNYASGTNTVFDPVITENYFSGDTMGAGAIAIKVIRVRNGEITNNSIAQNFDIMIDQSETTEWYSTVIFGNYISPGDSWDTGTYASLPIIARVPTGGTGQIYGSAKITGNLEVTGDINGSTLKTAVVSLSNAEIKALRVNGKTLLAAPAAGYFYEIVSVTLLLNYGSNALTESSDNLAIRYLVSGTAIIDPIEATGFIDATADTMMILRPVNPIPATAATNIVARGVAIGNIGDGEYGGNAGNDTTMLVIINYRLHASGL